MAYNPNVPAPTNRVQDDLNAIRENFQHLDPLAPYVQALLDSRIVEMGSNSNGEYVRWENGLQICFVLGVAFTGDGATDEKTGSWTHPAAFASPPAIVGRNAHAQASPNWHLEVNPGSDAGVTNVFWRAYRTSGSWNPEIGYPLHYIAIGRWK